ncbi:MAG TPA: DUF5522 domain-containing protein [Pyrinomonadaceae bacterium]|jgi:hypothetical protein
MEKNSGETKESKPNKFVENVDYYFENGLMVLTEHFLKKRGHCCKNGCRHCPYQKKEEIAL